MELPWMKPPTWHLEPEYKVHFKITPRRFGYRNTPQDRLFFTREAAEEWGRVVAQSKEGFHRPEIFEFHYITIRRGGRVQRAGIPKTQADELQAWIDAHPDDPRTCTVLDMYVVKCAIPNTEARMYETFNRDAAHEKSKDLMRDYPSTEVKICTEEAYEFNVGSTLRICNRRVV